MHLTHAAALALLVAFVTLAGCAQPPAEIVFPGKQWQTATPASQGLEAGKVAEAVAFVRSVVGKTGTSEMMIVRNGYVVWQGENVDHVQLIWSCTKSFTSTCFGLLWDDGLVEPGELAWKRWPEMKALYPEVTFRQLGTFTSGYARAEGGTSLELAPPLYQPGEKFRYSREPDLMAAILTRSAGRSLKDLFLERIGHKIGMDGDEFVWGVQTTAGGVEINGGTGRPESGVRTSARHFARFGWLYCCGGEWNGERLISRRYIDFATVPRVGGDVPPYDPNAWYVRLPGNYGFNWWTNGPDPEGVPHWPSAPRRTFAAQGNKNNICFIVPEWRMVIVRMGGDRIIDMSLYDRMFELLRQAGADR